MQRIDTLMNIFMGITLSSILTFVGMLASGHFTVLGWLVSFCVSFCISLLLGFIFPVRIISENICTKLKISYLSLKGRFFCALVLDAIYTPLITAVMVILMTKVTTQNEPIDSIPGLGFLLLRDCLASFVLGYIIIFLVHRPYVKLLLKMTAKWKVSDKAPKGRFFASTLALIVVSFLLSTGLSLASIHSVISSENRDMAQLISKNLYDEIYMELERFVSVGHIVSENKELQQLLKQGGSSAETENCISTILQDYQNHFGFDTVFAISYEDGRYYTQKGYHTTVDPQSVEHDSWYSSFLNMNVDYSFDIDSDGKGHEWMLFLNYRITDENGDVIGVCGVSSSMRVLQNLLRSMEEEYDITATIVDNNGVVKIDEDDLNIDGPQRDIYEVAAEGDKQIELGTSQYVENTNGYTIVKPLSDIGWNLLITRKVSEVKILLDLMAQNMLVMMLIFGVFILISAFLLKKGSKLLTRNIMMGSYNTLTTVYDGVYILDLANGAARELKNLFPDSRHIFDETRSLSEQKVEVMKAWVEPEYYEYFTALHDKDTIFHSFAGRNSQSFRFKAKELGWCRATFVCVSGDGYKTIDHMIFVVEIIDEEVRKQEELLRETEMAKAASEAKGNFLAKMSHEIRTPINAVIGMDTMILRETKDSIIKRYAMDIHTAGNTLLSLVNDILDFSKIESGKMELVPVDYDFSSMVNDVLNMVTVRAEDKGLQIIHQIDGSIPSVLVGDDVRLRQILMNILSNAVKYTEQGSVTFSVSGTEEKGFVVLHFSVKDTGIGIREEDLPKLFADFERIDEARNRMVEGTGLGMSITSQLLKLMDSKLEVSSVYGQGSEFCFDVRQEIRNPEPIGDFSGHVDARAEAFDYEASFIAPEARILVVDDNETNRMVFGSLLKDMQLQIDEAGGGLAGIDKIMRYPYDIIFLDHMMPDVDGIEVLQRVKARIASGETCANSDTPVIALTANAISGAREIYMAAGFSDYLSKPIIPDKLEKMITLYLPKDLMKPYQKKVSVNVGLKAATFIDELPLIEGLDWYLAGLHFPDKEDLLAAVASYYQSIDASYEQLEKLYEAVLSNRKDEENLKQYRIKIHSIKSAANLIGLTAVAGTAAMLEYAARDGKVEMVCQVTPHFLESFFSYKEKLLQVLPTEPEEELKEYDAAVLKTCLHRLVDAAELLDVNEMDDIVTEMQGYRYPAAMEDLMSALKGAVAGLAVEDIEAVSEEMILMADEK